MARDAQDSVSVEVFALYAAAGDGFDGRRTGRTVPAVQKDHTGLQPAAQLHAAPGRAKKAGRRRGRAAAKPQKTAVTVGKRIPSNKYCAARKARRETTTKAARDEATASMLLPSPAPPAGHVPTGSCTPVEPLWGSMRGPPARGNVEIEVVCREKGWRPVPDVGGDP